MTDDKYFEAKLIPHLWNIKTQVIFIFLSLPEINLPKMELNVILFLAITLLLSYGIEIIAKKIKIPSILLLLIVGILLRVSADEMGFIQFNLLAIVPIVGTLGLILIVFEGGLELNYEKRKRKLILKSFFSAIACFTLTTVFIAVGLYLLSNSTIRIAFINAIPIAIISSAIAIPAARFLHKQRREFIIYESVFSDIIGIIAFNYIIKYEEFKTSIIFSAFFELIAVVILCLCFCSAMLIMLKNNKHHVKYVMIIASLVLVYSLGKVFHLPTLIVALVFGLTLRNIYLLDFKFVRKYLLYPNFSEDLRSLEQITQEGVFIIKTFFFILLGYMIDLSTTITFINIGVVLSLLIMIYVLRWLVLRSLGKDIGGEFYLAPRGLITILLFVSIPSTLNLPIINMELLLLLILINSLIIPVAFVQQKKIDILKASV